MLTSAKIPIGGNHTESLDTDIREAKMARRGCSWGARKGVPPFRYTPNYLVASPSQSFNLTAAAYGTVNIGPRGGGGDYKADYACSFSYEFPDLVKKYLSYDGINATLIIQVGSGAEIDLGKSFTINVDWNSWLDKVVVLSVNNVISEGNVRAYVFNVWGVLRTNLPVVSTIINISYGWITNDHEANYANFQAHVKISSTFNAVRDSVTPALSMPFGFELLNVQEMLLENDESDI